MKILSRRRKENENEKNHLFIHDFVYADSACCGCGDVTDETSGGGSGEALASDGVSDSVSEEASSQSVSDDVSEEISESGKEESVTGDDSNTSLDEHKEETASEKFERITGSDNFITMANLADVNGIQLETVYSDMFCPHCGNCMDVFQSVPFITTTYTSILDQEKNENAPQNRSIEILGKEYSLTLSYSYTRELLGNADMYKYDDHLGYVTFDTETDKIISLSYYPEEEELPATEEEAVSIIKELVESMGHSINYDEFDYTCTTSVEKKYSNGTYHNFKEGFATPEENEVLEYRQFVYRKIPHGVYTNESITVKFEPKSERQDEDTITIRIYDYDDEMLNDMVEKALPYVDKIESIVLNNLMQYHNKNYEVLGITKDNAVCVEMREGVIYIVSEHSIAMKRIEYSKIDPYYKGEIASVVTLTKIE